MEQPPSPDKESPHDEDAPEFPRGPTKPGKVYCMESPFGEMVCIMSEPTWLEFATRQESMRQMLAKQDSRIKELLAENAAANILTADSQRRLDNIRHARRQELRRRIEPEVKELLLPNDEDFAAPDKRKN
jgi:hypothetical protein